MSRDHARHKSYRYSTIKYGRFLDIPNSIFDWRWFYSSYGYVSYHGHYIYHPYRRNDRKYFADELKKVKPPAFDG